VVLVRRVLTGSAGYLPGILGRMMTSQADTGRSRNGDLVVR